MSFESSVESFLTPVGIVVVVVVEVVAAVVVVVALIG